MKVNKLMSVAYVSLPTTASLFNVVEAMTRENKSCVIICEGNSPVGIVTERDIVRVFREAIDQKQVNDILITEIMTRDPICTFAESDLYEALLLARRHRIRHIPVIDNHEQLVGLLTQTDTLEAYITAWEKTTELEAANEHLKLLSLEDSLLHIGNRRSLNLDLSHIEAASARSKTHYSIAMIDVDNFKLYNDYYGHQEGDKTLVKIVEAIKINKREQDRVYRYGGEEILLLMPNTALHEACCAADRIRESISELAIPHVQSATGNVTVSIGVASSSKRTWKQTIKVADLVLYQAKRDGKNRTCKAEK